MLIKIVDDDQVFAKKIESMVYDGFKDIFLDYSIDCITSNFEDRYFERGQEDVETHGQPRQARQLRQREDR